MDVSMLPLGAEGTSGAGAEGDGRVFSRSASVGSGGAARKLQQAKSPVLGKAAVESDGIGDTSRSMTVKLMASQSE